MPRAPAQSINQGMKDRPRLVILSTMFIRGVIYGDSELDRSRRAKLHSTANLQLAVCTSYGVHNYLPREAITDRLSIGELGRRGFRTHQGHNLRASSEGFDTQSNFQNIIPLCALEIDGVHRDREVGGNLVGPRVWREGKRGPLRMATPTSGFCPSIAEIGQWTR